MLELNVKETEILRKLIDYEFAMLRSHSNNLHEKIFLSCIADLSKKLSTKQQRENMSKNIPQLTETEFMLLQSLITSRLDQIVLVETKDDDFTEYKKAIMAIQLKLELAKNA